MRRVLVLLAVVHLLLARAALKAYFASLTRGRLSALLSERGCAESDSVEELLVSVSVSLEMAADQLALASKRHPPA